MSQPIEITVCLGSSCFSRGNRDVLEIIKSFLKQHHLENKVFFHGDLCTGHCENGPIVKIDNQLFENVNTDNIDEILNTFFNNQQS